LVSISRGNLKGSCLDETVGNAKNYTCTYTDVKTFTPSVKVVDLYGNTYYPKAPKIDIEDEENSKPEITIEKDETIYSKGEKITLKAIASDSDGEIKSIKWEGYRNSLELFNNTSLDNAYLYAPAVTEDKIKYYLFKLTVIDNDNTEVSKLYTVKVQGTTTSKRELTYIEDVNYADSCASYNETGCAYAINSNLTTLTKKWKYKNTGNIDLTNLSFLLIDNDKGNISIERINLDKTSLKEDEELIISMDISIPSSLVDGEYSARWKIKSNGETIKFPNENDATMFFKFNLNRGIASTTSNLEDLLVGKTFYHKCGTKVETLSFYNNGKIKIIKSDATDYEDYKIIDNTVETTDSGKIETHTYTNRTSKYLIFEDNDNDITKLYYSKVNAESSASNTCGDSSVALLGLL
ncbi:MAG: PKD domain-containing protein, partial [Fusobacterium sp.]